MSLLGLLSDGQIHHVTAPEETLLPYATFFEVSDVPVARTTVGLLRQATLQINVHASTDSQARSIADQLATAMDTILSGGLVPILIYGRNALHSLAGEFGIEQGEGLGPDGQDCWICHFTLDIPYTK